VHITVTAKPEMEAKMRVFKKIFHILVFLKPQGIVLHRKSKLDKLNFLGINPRDIPLLKAWTKKALYIIKNGRTIKKSNI